MTDHYFSSRPGSDDRRRVVTAWIWGELYEFSTAAGVFARDGLDRGTAMLFRGTRPPSGPAGNLLDLGCGYGPIAIALARHCPQATVWAVDVNERALELTGHNAIRNGVADQVRVVRPEQVGDEVTFEQLWSNPPIRAGKAELHALLSRWLPRVSGPSWLVVGRNLGADSLQRWLADQGWTVRRVAGAKGFRVLQITR